MRRGQHVDLEPKDNVLDCINPPGICIPNPMSCWRASPVEWFTDEGVGLLADI